MVYIYGKINKKKVTKKSYQLNTHWIFKGGISKKLKNISYTLGNQQKEEKNVSIFT